MEVLIGNDPKIFRHVETILQNVFIEEQGVPEDEIFDGKTDMAMHVVMIENGAPAATARMIKEANQWRIGLVAVEKKMRGLQYGRKIMDAAIEYIKGAGGTDIVLTAQNTAKAFYEKLGFVQCGEEIHFESGFVLVPMSLCLGTEEKETMEGEPYEYKKRSSSYRPKAVGSA